MPNMSNYAESGILTLFFRSGSFSKPAAIAIALATGTLAETQTGDLGGNEVPNAGGYSRVYLNPSDSNWASITQTAVGSGTTSNTPAITFPTATANWGTITDVAICDTGTFNGGNMLFYGKLTTPKTVQNGDTFSFAAGGNLSMFCD